MARSHCGNPATMYPANMKNCCDFELMVVRLVMPRSHSGEGAMMISANIEEQRRLQIRQKKWESVVT